MTAAAVTASPAALAPPDPIAVYRDDGPLARALGTLLGGALRLPGAALLLVALLALVAAIAIGGGDTPRPVAAAVLALVVLLGGASSGAPPRPKIRWAELPLLRGTEYMALIWIAALEGPDAYPAAFALLAALAFRHYDLVYRLRHRGVTPATWVNALSGGWDGRIVVGFLLLLAGALPAGYFVAAARARRRVRRRGGLRLARGRPRAAAARVRGRGGRGPVIGMVLAAGAGTRLGPETAELPKTLLRVDGDRTILDVALGNLRHVGLEQAVVVSGYAHDRLAERVPDARAPRTA